MRLRRKGDAPEVVDEVVVPEPIDMSKGPWDIDDVASLDGYVDFGSLLVPVTDAEMRLNLDEVSGQIMSVAWVTEDAALEVSVFAAPKAPGVWDDLRPELEADARQRGGTVDHADGPFGVEVIASIPVQMPDGTGAIQASKIFTVQGSRWLLRGALMGRPVVEPEYADSWYALFGSLIVRRGSEAKPIGEALELRLPSDAQMEVNHG